MAPFSSVVSLNATFTTSRAGGCATLRCGQSCPSSTCTGCNPLPGMLVLPVRVLLNAPLPSTARVTWHTNGLAITSRNTKPASGGGFC